MKPTPHEILVRVLKLQRVHGEWLFTNNRPDSHILAPDGDKTHLKFFIVSIQRYIDGSINRTPFSWPLLMNECNTLYRRIKQ